MIVAYIVQRWCKMGAEWLPVEYRDELQQAVADCRMVKATQGCDCQVVDSMTDQVVFTA